MENLIELDSLDIVAIVDNELDPLSRPSDGFPQGGGVKDIALNNPALGPNIRGGDTHEFRMDRICCGAHGLSLMITGRKGDLEHTMLFDAGPEGHVWERNAKRLGVDLGKIELIQLSHWHRDHSGGLLTALEVIHADKESKGHTHSSVHVDLHPDRPEYRGSHVPGLPVFSLEADPTFDEIRQAHGNVDLTSEDHTVLDNMFLISGEIPRLTEYETGFKFGVRFDGHTGKWIKDEEIVDERLLACRLKGKGLVVFSGCGHAGVVNSTRHAVQSSNGAPLYAIMGGFHLADSHASKIDSTVSDIKALDPQYLLAGHCTGWRAKFAMEREMPGRLIPSFVGSTYTL